MIKRKHSRVSIVLARGREKRMNNWNTSSLVAKHRHFFDIKSLSGVGFLTALDPSAECFSRILDFKWHCPFWTFRERDKSNYNDKASRNVTEVKPKDVEVEGQLKDFLRQVRVKVKEGDKEMLNFITFKYFFLFKLFRFPRKTLSILNLSINRKRTEKILKYFSIL